jgi:cysteine synthase A
MRVFESITETIGNTPLVKLGKLPVECKAQILVKCEFFNPLGSVKDRIAKAMIDDAEAKGKLKPGMRIVEPTSGNTGIGLAFIAAARGYPITLVMPETMSMERRILLRMLGADIVLTPGPKGMNGASIVAKRMVEADSSAFMPSQFTNPANPRIHHKTTAEEIWNDTNGAVDILVAGVGTGGTITGVGENLRAKKSGVGIVAVEPSESPVLSGGSPSPHKIQGIGAGFVPEILNTKIYDEVVKVSSEEALEMARKVIASEGLPVGISSGAVIKAAIEVGSRPQNAGKIIVVIAASSTERYLSTLLAEKARGEVAALPVEPV